VVAAAIGFPTGFLRLEPADLPAATLIRTSVVLFLHPSFVEELIFRVLPIPHPREGASSRTMALWTAVGLVLFIVVHPLNGLLLRPAAFTLFTSPAYLVMVGLLGLACAVAYVRSASIWPPVLLHWLAVNVWIFLLGGNAILGGR